MHFHYSEYFFLLIPLAGLAFLFLYSKMKRRTELKMLGEWGVIQKLIPIDALLRRNKKDVVALVALGFLVLATTGPQFGASLKEVKQRGVDVFIAVDTSRSMEAEDVTPSRLSRAKRSLSLLIQKLEGNRVGIIAFAKFPVIQCPLTVDSDAARMFLDILDTNTVPEQGTSIGEAIRLAIKSFGQNEKEGKAIVLLTDGEDHRSDPVGAAKEAKDKGIVLYTIGIGSTQGEVIKDRDDQGQVKGYHKYKGDMVMTRLDDALLTKIATLTGGKYFRASSTDKEIDEIADQLSNFDKREFSSKIFQQYKERYQILAFLAFLLLIFEFLYSEKTGQRQRILDVIQTHPFHKNGKKAAVTVGLLILFNPTHVLAHVRDHVLKGNSFVKKQRWAEARGEFESARIDAPESPLLPYNIANTYYLEGQFDEAKSQYEQAQKMATDPDLKSKIAFNMGHLLFSMKDKPGAIEQFKECLKYNPKDVDAKYNIEYIKAGKEPKNPPQQKEKNQNSPSDQNKSDGKNDNNDQKNQEQKDQQAKADSNQGSQKKDELTKEEADRILQLIQNQEKDKLNEQKPKRVVQPQNKDKKDEAGEDW